MDCSNRNWRRNVPLARSLGVLALLFAVSPAKAGCGDHVFGSSRGAMLRGDVRSALGDPSHSLPGAPKPCNGPTCGQGEQVPLVPSLPPGTNLLEQWPMLNARLDLASATAAIDRKSQPDETPSDPLRSTIFHPPR